MPARVLTVDDDLDVLDLLRIYLEPLYTVLQAKSGIEGYAAFERERPDLVVTDLGMPGMNGLDLAAKIKAHPELGGTPVVILTGATQDEELPGAFWCKFTEADVFFEKPCRAEELRSAIDRLLKKRAGFRELPPGKGHYD